MSSMITFNDVDIIFGDASKDVLRLVDQGKSREEIQSQTGLVMGVAGASLEIKQGEILVLMGLSGSGKSTLLRAVNGLAPVVRGDVQVATPQGYINPYKCSSKQLRKLRTETVSMVFQQFGLLPWRNVADNIGFGLELAGVPESVRRRHIAEQLELVNLKDWANRKVGELSGGMQQRVGLARAFATGAPILLMDEPFSALDPLIRTRLQNELLEFQRKLNKTIIFVSHDLDEAFRIGNRIAMMEGGRIVQCGTPQEIVRNPQTQYVADFVQNMNPLSYLCAQDVMVQGLSQHQGQLPVTGTVSPDTPLPHIIDALARQNGVIGVTENGVLVGAITPEDIFRGLSRQRHR